MGSIVSNSKYNNRLDWLVDKTICETFHLKLNTKEKRAAVTVAFVVSYALLPLALYFGFGSFVMGACVFTKGFAVTKMGVLMIGVSSAITLALLAINIYIVLRRDIPCPTRVIAHSIPTPLTVNLPASLPARKPLEKFVINREELEQVFDKGTRNHQVFLDYISFPPSKKEKELRLRAVMTRLVNKREFAGLKYLAHNIDNIDTPCIGKKRKTLIVCALERRNFDLVEFLLLNKANPNQAYNERDSLLSFACKKAVSTRRLDLTFVKSLLEFGAQVEPRLLEEYSTFANHIGTTFIQIFLDCRAKPSILACKNAAHHNLSILELYLTTFPSIVKDWGVEIFESAWEGKYCLKSIDLLLDAGFLLRGIEKDILKDAVLRSDEDLVKLLVGKGKLKVKRTNIVEANNLLKLVRGGAYDQDDYPIGRIFKYLRKQYKRAGLLQRAYAARNRRK